MLIIAHRGASGTLPENTLASFAKAVKLGAEMVELDVHLCATGELVVIHDASVNHTTNGRGLVSKKTLTQLQNLDAGMREKIPTLNEVLALIDRNTRVNIELKGPGVAPEVARTINRLLVSKKWTAWDFIISSFHHGQLKRFHSIIPEIQIGILYKNHPTDYLKLAGELNAFSINLPLNKVNVPLIHEVHRHKLQVWVYTVNKIQEYQKAEILGVDAIFTNFPELFL